MLVAPPSPVSYRVGVQGVGRATFFRVLLLSRVRAVSSATCARLSAHVVRNDSVGTPFVVSPLDTARIALQARILDGDFAAEALGHEAADGLWVVGVVAL